MRYIDLDELLKKRNGWGHSKELWKNKNLKKDFYQFGYGKCWYIEVKVAGSFFDIDHFRPKGSIKQYEEHYKKYYYNKVIENQGYNWLINEPKNYRFSCNIANRPYSEGGKHSYFPLKDGSPLLTENGNEVEIPILLDPCNKEDVNLIYFSGNEIKCTSKDSFDQMRVDVSKIIYNMNDAMINQNRSKLWNEIEKTIEEYNSEDITEKACLRRLNDYISNKSEFSACAISAVNMRAPDNIKAKLNLEL